VWLSGLALLLLVVGAVWYGADTVSLMAPGDDTLSSGSSSVSAVSTEAEAARGYRIPGGSGTALAAARNATSAPGSNNAMRSTEIQREERISALLEQRNSEKPRNAKDQELLMPEWDKIFVPGGFLQDAVNAKGMFGSNGLPDFIDLYGGIEAEFAQENISNGVATDMSALLIGRNLEDEVLYNGAVRAEHDLGNAYVLATIEDDSHLRVYAGVERLITDAGTFIEFEFNQNRVHVTSGSPWPIVGARTNGDLMVRMVFSGRSLQSVELERWHQGGYQFINTGSGISGNRCAQTRPLMYCVGPPPMRHPEEGFEVWDENNQLVDPVLADDFVEVGIDVDLLIGPQSNIASVLFRTPEDIVMTSFGVFNRMAYAIGPSGVKSELTN
jgi:hypothetical protein